MLPRFYAPSLAAGGEFTLPEEEAHHLTRVLRLGAGAPIVVFDGRGAQWEALVLTAARDRVVARAMAPLPVPAAPAVAVHVVQAVLKGSSMDDAVRDATMMGAVAIEPVMTEHVDVKPAVAMREGNVERWQRIALSSVKQCRRVTLPQILPPRPLTEWLAAPSAEMVLMFVEPSLDCSPQPLKSLLEFHVPAQAAVLIGPEGGWSGGEIDAALAAGCTPVSLGPLTLRAESMAVAALAALNAIWPA